MTDRAMAWTVLRHGARRGDYWRIVYSGAETTARTKFAAVKEALRQGGVRLLDPNGNEIALCTAPRLRTRW